ncbi:Hypothetical predicted protein [Paramuricea clavata]|uniref:Uncharacterized protein n=1 Tax=Paramuricea clavata TaxID=317549 RepID=A0A6S7HCX9_PARCT|nr:Hypothetical predicted protein [Paramuricea clavata]
MEVDSMSQLEKKRERENKISKLMGEYLLKGYKMLGSTCNVCGTILLKDRQQQDYCIGCSEVDIHIAHNVSQQQPQVTEHESLHNKNPEFENHRENGGPSCTNETLMNVHKTTPLTGPEDSGLTTVNEAIFKLQERLMWAVNQLGVANSVEMDIKLCELISSCGNALRTLKDLQH